MKKIKLIISLLLILLTAQVHTFAAPRIPVYKVGNVLYFFDKSFKFADIAPNAQEKAQYLPIFPPAAHLSGVWGASEAIKIITKQREFQAGYFQSFDFQNKLKANQIANDFINCIY